MLSICNQLAGQRHLRPQRIALGKGTEGSPPLCPGAAQDVSSNNRRAGRDGVIGVITEWDVTGRSGAEERGEAGFVTCHSREAGLGNPAQANSVHQPVISCVVQWVLASPAASPPEQAVTHTHTPTHTHTVHILTHINKHTYAYTHSLTHTLTNTHTRTHTHTQTHIRINM